jgi:hypothetical protein
MSRVIHVSRGKTCIYTKQSASPMAKRTVCYEHQLTKIHLYYATPGTEITAFIPTWPI